MNTVLQAETTDGVDGTSEAKQARQRRVSVHAASVGIALVVGVVAYYLLTHLTGQNGQVVLLVSVSAIAVIGLNIIQGLGGYPSLAQASFFGGGAYLSSLILDRGHSMIISAVGAVLAMSVAGLVIGLIFGRTRGQYFAIGTLFFSAVVTLVLNNEVDVTGGPNGLPVGLGWETDTTLKLIAGSLTAGLVIFHVLSESRFGARLRSIREDEDLAEHLGVPTSRAKLIALTLSATFGAWAGVLLAQYNGVIAPSQFTYQQGFLLFVAIGLGGYGRLLTPVIGAVLVVGLPQLLNLGPGVSQIGLGVIFIAVTLLMPGGILGVVAASVRHLYSGVTQRAGTRS